MENVGFHSVYSMRVSGSKGMPGCLRERGAQFLWYAGVLVSRCWRK